MNSTEWRLRDRTLPLTRPLVMGIVNVTPDSFSDGGAFFDAGAAVAHAERLLTEGADILDIGGESTRPQGAEPVSEEEEVRRVIPVLREIVRAFPGAPVSVDTVKSGVAERALGEGVQIVNDVSSFRLDPRMAGVCGREGAGVVLMHSRGSVSDMATFAHANYDGDVVDVVLHELRERLGAALDAGVDASRIALDPGIGFAKRSEDSLRLLASLDRLAALGHPVVVGASRKRFIGELSGEREARSRVFGSVGAAVAAYDRGAHVLRVHDVAATRQALDVAAAVRAAAGPMVHA